MAGILTIGGPDQVKIEQIFPSTQKTFAYNFGQNITGWTFLIDYQTIIVDTIYFDRSGNPSFDNSNVIGYFPKQVVSSPYAPQVVNASTGAVNIFIPGNMYTGPIIPDARQDVPVTVVGPPFPTHCNNLNVAVVFPRTSVLIKSEPFAIPKPPNVGS